MRKALIIGVSGQDGAYLAKLLLSKGYVVLGSSRDHESNSFHNLLSLDIKDKVSLTSIDTNDFRSVITALSKYGPDEIYNLAGQTSVGLSFTYPVETFNSILIGTMNLLECVRVLDMPARIYNAGSGEVFGHKTLASDENTPFSPQSPYGTAKAAATYAVSNYREAYGMFCCTGILFNHESPLRPQRFVTQKIIQSARLISAGAQNKLRLGNIDVARDWGWAPDYVEAMWLMLNAEKPKDYVVASGRQRSLRDFLKLSFEHVGLDWQDYVVTDSNFLRPLDIKANLGNPELALLELGWRAKTSFEEVVKKLSDGNLY
jgi:GDPmannose 4,6-dehydratase